jgi:predicted porin
MKKSFLVSGALFFSFCIFVLSAQAETVLSGGFHASLDFGDNGKKSSSNVTSNLSTFSISGSEKIGGNLSGIFQVTNNIAFSSQGSSTLAACDTFVGLSGGFGEIKIGKLFAAVSIPSAEFNMFSGQVGDSLDILNYTGSNIDGFIYDECYADSIMYSLPQRDGLPTASIQYVPSEDDSDSEIFSIGGLYSFGPVTLGLGYESQGKGYNIGGKSSNAFRIGLGGSFGNINVNGIYQAVKNASGFKGVDANVYGVSGSYAFGRATLKASYFQTDNEGKNNNASLVALGLDYALSKRTTVYGAYAIFNNDKNVDYGIGNGYGDHGNLGILPETGRDFSVFSLGVMHNF